MVEPNNPRVPAEMSHSEGVIAGAAAMLQGHLGEMRAIKNAESAWVDRFSVLMFPLIVFLLGSTGRVEISLAVLSAISVGIFFLTLWFQDMLRKERRSYYRIARSTVRLQNYLGLIKEHLIPAKFADPFPKGFGFNPETDGTQPFSSFFRRQLFTALVLTFAIVSVVLHNPRLWGSALLIVFDGLWLVQVFRIDRNTMVHECLSEQGLTGSAREWYPNASEQIEKLAGQRDRPAA